MSSNAETDNNNDLGSQNEPAPKDSKAQAKGGKKNKKGKTMSLAAFNAQSSGNDQSSVSNWADHVETVSSIRPSQPISGWQPKQSTKYHEPDSAYDLDVDPIRSQLPTAPRAAREPNTIDLTRIPENGPFKVHVGNLPFDISELAVANFFGTDEKQVNLIREQNRPKGFGFVELDSRDHLITALEKNGELLHGRAIKVALATAPTNAEGERYRDRDERQTRSWRNEAPREEVDRNWRDRGSDSRGPERRDDRNDRSDRRFDDRDDRRFDDRDDRRYDDRSGRQYEDRYDRRSDDRDRRPDDRDRRYDGGRRYGDRRQYDDRRQPDETRGSDQDRDEETRPEESNWRRGLSSRKAEELNNETNEPVRSDEPERELRRAMSPRSAEERRGYEQVRERTPERRTAPLERPKLNLQPRTKPLGELGSQSGMSDAARKAIFGGAKPVDTIARDREIEQRLDAEREKFERAHELDEAVANASRTRRRTVSSSSNASQSHKPQRPDEVPPVERERERERLNSARSNASRLPEEDDSDFHRDRQPAAYRGERTWYRGGPQRGRSDRGSQRGYAYNDRRPGTGYGTERQVPTGNDEYFYDDDFRSEQPQVEIGDDETPTYYGSAAHKQRSAQQGTTRKRPDDRGAPRNARNKPLDAADEEGFQQVGAGGRAVPGGSGTHRPGDYPGGKPTSGAPAAKRPEAVKKDETQPTSATLIHKSKFSALAANFDDEGDASDEE